MTDPQFQQFGVIALGLMGLFLGFAIRLFFSKTDFRFPVVLVLMFLAYLSGVLLTDLKAHKVSPEAVVPIFLLVFYLIISATLGWFLTGESIKVSESRKNRGK